MADELTRIVDEVHERHRRAEEWESTARANWKDDVKFVNADTYNRDQWPSDVWKARNAPGEAPRPTLTINRVMQHCLQITNDARQNQMSVKVNAVGFGSTSKAADAIEGICRHIEYQSNAQQNAYALATMHQVQGGIGWVHIQTDYVPGLDTFDQDIFIKAVQDPLTVFSDPDCQEPDHSDMRWAMIVEDIPREVFKSQYPEHAEIGDLAPMAGLNAEWRTKDHVRACRYYRLAENDDTLWLVPDAPAGADGTEAVPGGPIRQSRMPAEVLEMARAEKWRSRPITERVVEWYLLAGDEVIDHGDTVFDHIPLVPWLGIEVVLDGQLDRKGHVRNLIDPQRMYNYSAPLALDTPLPTPAGWTTIGDVTPGDVLLDENGRPAEVLGLSPTYINRKCYRVEFSGGSSIIADAEHGWTVEERGKRKDKTFDWSVKTVTTDDLTPGKHFIYATKPLDLPDIDLPIHPYVLGVWLGDGTTKDGKISSGVDDMEEMSALLESCGYRTARRIYSSSTAATIGVYGLKVQLAAAKLLGNKHIPEIYLRASRSQREMLLQGLMDTDGNVTKAAQCAFTNGNPAIVQGFMELLRSLGIQPQLTRIASASRMFPGGQVRECQSYERIFFSADPDVQAFRLERKLARQGKNRPLHARRTKRHRILSVTEVPSVPVRCLAIDTPTHLFLAGEGMVPTHNSAFVEHVALQTKAPWLIDERAIEGYESFWRKANVANLPYLPWRALDPDTGQATIPQPSRVEPPAFSQAHTMGMQIADQQMQVASGQYQAEMGAPGNEKSGTAIAQRQRQADTSTYHFTDAQGAALRLIGRILIGAIPKVYDTTRAVQVLAMDGSRSGVIIDPSIDTAHKMEAPPAGPNGQPMLGPDGEPMKDILVINPTVGRFDVEADVGAGFGTRRQEAWNAIVQVLQQAPEFASKVGDLLFKAGDFPFSDEIAERLAPASDDPNTAALNAQLQQATQAIAQLKAQLLAEKGRTDGMVARAQADMHGASLDAANDSAQTQIARYKAETDRMGTIGSIDPEMLRPILRQLVAEEMGGQHWSQVPTVGQNAPQGPLPLPPQGSPQGPPPGASGPGPGGPGGPAALPRLPSTNPPGGPISSPNVSNGAVR